MDNDTPFARIDLGKGRFALVDYEDYAWLSTAKWHFTSGGYARGAWGGSTQLMHRIITNAPPGTVVHHKNHDRLDNRRCNLLIATHAENSRGRPGGRRDKGGKRPPRPIDNDVYRDHLGPYRLIHLDDEPHGKTTKVDPEEYDRLQEINGLGRPRAWHLSVTGYAASRYSNTGGAKYMHRILMNPEEGLVVDHINGDPLDNRKSNLRVVSREVNARNRRPTNGRLKGISEDKRRGTWRAIMKIDGRQYVLGEFQTPKEAAEVYDAVARYYSPFTPTNFPGDRVLTIEEARSLAKESRRMAELKRRGAINPTF